MDQNSQQDNSNAQNQDQVNNQVQPQAVSSPVSSPQKEQIEPVLGQTPPEWVKPSEKEPEIHPEIAEAGIKETSELPELKEDHKKAGIELAKESTPVSTEPLGIVELPMTQAQASNIVKKNKDSANALVWLAILVLKQIKKMHGKLLNKNLN